MDHRKLTCCLSLLFVCCARTSSASDPRLCKLRILDQELQCPLHAMHIDNGSTFMGTLRHLGEPFRHLTRSAYCVALSRVLDTSKAKIHCKAINVGTGTGSSVLEMVAAMEKACGKRIPYAFAPRRAGDTEAVWAATEMAQHEMGWKAKYTVEDMCRDQWRWASMFPKGYE